VSGHLVWYLARAAGILAWLLATAAVIWGLLLSTKLLHRKPSPRWLLDLHRFLGALAVVFVGFHIAALIADNYVHFGLADVLVPFASGWRRGAVALGVLAFWLLLAVEVTSLLMRRLPRRRWHQLHLASYAVFWATTFHALLAGTDSRGHLFHLVAYVSIAVVGGLSVLRALQSSHPDAPRPSLQPTPLASHPVPPHPARPPRRPAPTTPPRAAAPPRTVVRTYAANGQPVSDPSTRPR
jgi:sulfoxide reductase heme-binding subunit YedZ